MKINAKVGREGKHRNSNSLPKHIFRCSVHILYQEDENYMLLTVLFLD